MPLKRVKSVEIDDLVNLHLDQTYSLDHQHKKAKIKKEKYKSQTKPKPVIKPSSQFKKNKLKRGESMDSLPSCSNYSRNDKSVKKQRKNASIPDSKNFPSDVSHSFIEEVRELNDNDEFEESDSQKNSSSSNYSPTKNSTKAQTKDVFTPDYCSPNEDSIKDNFTPHSEDYPMNLSDYSFNENSQDLNDEYVREQLGILQTLHNKETELKTAIQFEKLKEEDEFLTDEALLKEKIAKLEDEVCQRRLDLKLKETMCSEIQFMETIRKIGLPPSFKDESQAKEVYAFTDREREIILEKLLKKEQLKQKLSSEQWKIAEVEEKCRKMKLAIEKCGDELTCEEPDSNRSDDWKELECLKTENQKRGTRIQLFSKLVPHLIENIKREHDVKEELKTLSSVCEKIQHWDYEDRDEIEELCREVHSAKI